MAKILALASDYDGTIADDGVTAASTIAALRRFKASGRKLILVTGRPLGELKEVLPELGLFDIAVIENGGVLYFPQSDTTRALATSPPEAFVARLLPHGLPEFAVGQTVVATKASEEAIVRDAIAALGLDLEVILNTDALMVLPRGVDKASGLRAALAELGLSSESVAGMGDAENDVAFLKLCGYAVAVANALPQVKAIADKVTTGIRGAGVEEFVASVLEGTDATGGTA